MDGFRLLALGAGLLFLLPLLGPGYSWTHDQYSYPLRVLGMGAALAEGQWDGGWVSDFARGYGYPFFRFYAPLFMYVGAALRGLGLSCAGAVEGAVLLFALLGSLGMYELGRVLWRGRGSACLVSVLWTFSSYRLFEVYVRGDFAEFAALNLAPWALWGQLSLLRGRWRACLAGAVAQAALICSHNISALVFQALLVCVALGVLVASRGGEVRRWRAFWLVLGQLLALGLSAWFWVPALAETSQVHIEAVAPAGSHYDVMREGNYLGLYQVFKPGWWGWVRWWGWGGGVGCGEDDGACW